MTTRLIDRGWDSEFTEALNHDSSYLRIICPFIKSAAIGRLLLHHPDRVRVITRFNLQDFAAGVSDVDALRQLLDANGRVRGIKNLHAKLYVFGKSRAIVTSANLTEAALTKNHEFGLITDDTEAVRNCLGYFDRLWQRGKPDVSGDEIENWDMMVNEYRLKGGSLRATDALPDHGADAGIAYTETHESPAVPDSRQAFVKFLGSSDNRVLSSASTIGEIRSAGCHWAATYPRNRRPQQVVDGDVIFMGRLIQKPNDIRIFGRATGMKYRRGHDDATEADISCRRWKRAYPHYIRVYNPEFLAGKMENGISLNELMEELSANSFWRTQSNSHLGEGNTNPRKAYLRQPSVRLSPEGFSWLNERLEAAFATHGKIPNDTLLNLDWPNIP